MYIVEFFKSGEEPDYHKVYVFNHAELLRLLDYIDKFEYILESVIREHICFGYEEFKGFDQEQAKIKEKGKKKVSHKQAKAIRKVLKKKGIEYRNTQYYSQAAGQPIFASPGRQDYQRLKKEVKVK